MESQRTGHDRGHLACRHALTTLTPANVTFQLDSLANSHIVTLVFKTHQSFINLAKVPSLCLFYKPLYTLHDVVFPYLSTFLVKILFLSVTTTVYIKKIIILEAKDS